jgi:hypothetical protein
MVRLFQGLGALRKPLLFGLYGAAGCLLADILNEGLLGRQRPEDFFKSLFMSGGWIATLGSGASLALIVGQNQYLQRRLLTLRQGAAGTVGGLAAGFVAGATAQAFFWEAQSGGGRIIAWALFGALLGWGMTFFVPNLQAGRALLGGALGGAVGAMSFLWAAGAFNDEVTVRLVSIPIVGFFIGLMVALSEALFREAWLEISYGPKEIRTVSLGREPVSIGSDPAACTVYTRNAPPLASRYTLEQGRVVYEDMALGYRTVLQPGDRRVIGNVTVAVRVAGTPVVAESTAQPSPAVPGAHGRISPASVAPGRTHGFSLQLSSGRTLQLVEGTQLSTRDIPGLEPHAANGIVAEVNHNPNDPTVLGLKNLSRRVWSATPARGEQRNVEPGKSVRLAAGTKITFGLIDGEIH